MTPEQLKTSILQYALRGKITSQNINEDAKKDYPNVKMANEEEAPYEIPNNWIWVALKEIATNQNGYAFKPSDWQADGKKIIRIQNLTDEKSPCNYCDDSQIEDKYKIKNGDVLVSWSCTIDAYLYQGDDAVLNQHIFKIVFDKIEMDKQFYIFAIKSLLATINSKRHGATMTHITKKDFESLYFPLPPLEEQHRIAEKVLSLFPYIDKYAIAYNKLEKLNSKFPEDMTKSVLQSAMQGRLVEQKREEGTGQDLYENIQNNYDALVSSGKLKKIKKFGEITEEEYPVDIPETWKWVYVNDIAFVTKLAGFEYTEYMSDAISNCGEVPIVRAKNIKPNRFMENTEEYISLELSEQLQRCALDEPCVLMTFIGAGIGEVAFFDNKRRNHLAPNVAKIVPHEDINKYLMYYFMSPIGRKEIFQFIKAVGQPSLSMDTIRKVKVPLPPIEEQKRIVSKIEELIPYCEQLAK